MTLIRATARAVPVMALAAMLTAGCAARSGSTTTAAGRPAVSSAQTCSTTVLAHLVVKFQGYVDNDTTASRRDMARWATQPDYQREVGILSDADVVNVTQGMVAPGETAADGVRQVTPIVQRDCSKIYGGSAAQAAADQPAASSTPTQATTTTTPSATPASPTSPRQQASTPPSASTPAVAPFASQAACEAKLPAMASAVSAFLASPQAAATVNAYSEQFAAEMGEYDSQHDTPSVVALFDVVAKQMSPIAACLDGFPTPDAMGTSSPADVALMVKLMARNVSGDKVVSVRISSSHGRRFALAHFAAVPVGSGQDVWAFFWRPTVGQPWQLLDQGDAGPMTNGAPADVLSELGGTSCGASPLCAPVAMHQ